MSDADVVREALIGMQHRLGDEAAFYPAADALDALDRLVARLAELEADLETANVHLRGATAAWNFNLGQMALLEEALREYADPSAWGRVVTAAGNRETVFLIMHDPPWKIADEALGGVRGGEEQRT